jgi:hypothetical protein
MGRFKTHAIDPQNLQQPLHNLSTAKAIQEAHIFAHASQFLPALVHAAI